MLILSADNLVCILCQTKTNSILNNITDDKVDDFMQDLKENRIEYLQGLSGWDKYGNGWTSRTNRYLFSMIKCPLL